MATGETNVSGKHVIRQPNVYYLHHNRTADVGEWLLYVQDSPNLGGSRGFSRGSIFASDGTLVASVAQEGLLRQRRPEAS